jgi:hypothetical protein
MSSDYCRSQTSRVHNSAGLCAALQSMSGTGVTSQAERGEQAGGVPSVVEYARVAANCLKLQFGFLGSRILSGAGRLPVAAQPQWRSR